MEGLNGLLDFVKTPAGQGLLAATFGGLAGARTGQPINSIGRAGLAGLSGYGNALERDQQTAQQAQAQELQRMQIDHMKKSYGREDALNALGPQFYKAGTSALPGVMGDSGLPAELQTGALPMAATPAIPASFDMKGYSNAVMGIDPQKGIALMQAMQKDTPFDKVSTDKFTPQSLAKFQATKNYGDLVPRDKLEFVEGVGVNPFDPKNAGRSIPNPNKPFTVGADGAFVPNVPYQNYELGKAKAGAPSMTAINNVQAFEPFANKVQGEMGSALVKNFETLQSIPQTLQALNSAKANLAKAGNFVGSGAETKLAVAKFFNNNLGTSIDPTGVKNTEALQSALFYNVMDNLKKMDASPSQQQQKTMQDAFGRITTDKNALPMIIDFYQNQVVSKANEHNRRVEGAANGPSKIVFPYDIRVNLPKDATESPSARTPVKTGVYGGKKVIQYSDGSTEYAN